MKLQKVNVEIFQGVLVSKCSCKIWKYTGKPFPILRTRFPVFTKKFVKNTGFSCLFPILPSSSEGQNFVKTITDCMGIPAGISGIQEWLKFAHFCIHEIKLTKGRIFQVQIPGTYPVIASSYWANFSQCMCKSFACFFDGQENHR